MQHLRDRKTRVEADEVGVPERAHGVVGAEPHGGVDRLDRADALIERIDRLVDHRQKARSTRSGGCDLVVEATSENEEVKRKIFTLLRAFLKPDAIVASNASSISIARLASATANSEQFIGGKAET
jgi:3-hydroxyacyl-CoA dehydrogenase